MCRLCSSDFKRQSVDNAATYTQIVGSFERKSTSFERQACATFHKVHTSERHPNQIAPTENSEQPNEQMAQLLETANAAIPGGHSQGSNHGRSLRLQRRDDDTTAAKRSNPTVHDLFGPDPDNDDDPAAVVVREPRDDDEGLVGAGASIDAHVLSFLTTLPLARTAQVNKVLGVQCSELCLWAKLYDSQWSTRFSIPQDAIPTREHYRQRASTATGAKQATQLQPETYSFCLQLKLCAQIVFKGCTDVSLQCDSTHRSTIVVYRIALNQIFQTSLTKKTSIRSRHCRPP